MNKCMLCGGDSETRIVFHGTFHFRGCCECTNKVHEHLTNHPANTEWMKRAARYEQARRGFPSVTGITDIDDVIEAFIESEKEVYALIKHFVENKGYENDIA